MSEFNAIETDSVDRAYHADVHDHLAAMRDKARDLEQRLDHHRRMILEFETLWEFLPEIENKYTDRLAIHLRKKLSKESLT